LNKLNSNKFFLLLAFFISPFFSLVLSFKNYKLLWSKNILLLYSAFFGYSFLINQNSDSDSLLYKEQFLKFANNKNLNIFESFNSEDSDNYDFIEQTISYLTSKITDNYRVLFSIYGIIFGFFYSRNIWSLFNLVKSKIKLVSLPIFIAFIFVDSIWQINGFRFWTATHIFFFAVYPFVLEKDKSKLGFLILAPLLHFSYIMPVIIFIAFVLIGNKRKLFFYLFISTFFLKNINIKVFTEIVIDLLPNYLVKKTLAYTNDLYGADLNDFKETKNWLANNTENLANFYFAVVIIFLYFRYKTFFNQNKNLDRLFCFTLLLYSFANIFGLVPSGSRFFYLAYLFALIFLFSFIEKNENDKSYYNFLYSLSPFLLLFTYMCLRVGLEYINFMCIFGNPISAFFINDDFLLIELIK